MRLSPDEFEALFGIRPASPISGAHLARAQEVYALLVDMRAKLGMDDLAVFRAAGLAPPYGRYLHALHECPESLIEFCKTELEKADQKPLAA